MRFLFSPVMNQRKEYNTEYRKEGNTMPNSAEGCGIYIHIPFCHSRCLYCAFYSSVGKSGLHSDYFEALKREAFERREWLLSHAPVRTVYWGGGTPSLPDARLIVDFMETLRHFFLLNDSTELQSL